MAKTPSVKVVDTATPSQVVEAKALTFAKFDASKTSTELTMDAKAINKAIGLIATSGAKYDKLVHETSIQAMLHAAAHNDCRPLTRIYFAINSGGRAKAFRAWVLEFAPLVWVKDKKGEAIHEHFKLKKEGTFNIADAAVTPYWELHKEPDPRDFTLLALQKGMASLVRRIGKHFDAAPEAERPELTRRQHQLLGLLPRDMQNDLADSMVPVPVAPVATA